MNETKEASLLQYKWKLCVDKIYIQHLFNSKKEKKKRIKYKIVESSTHG